MAWLIRIMATLAVVGALFLSSCATTPQPAGIGGFIGGQGAGDLVIRSSGFRFPDRIGHFRRVGGQQYDQAGQDLSVKYQAGALIVADVYEYPKRQSGATEFAIRKQGIKTLHADAKLLREESVTIHPGPTARSGRRALFAISQGYHYSFPPPYLSLLLVFERGERFLEYRITYAAAHRERAESEIDQFLDTLTWPED